MHLGYHELRNMLGKFKEEREKRKGGPPPSAGGAAGGPPPGGPPGRSGDRPRDDYRDRGGYERHSSSSRYE